MPSDAIIIQLDPGLAFGTGTHATTRLCLEWLEGNLVPGQQLCWILAAGLASSA